jgi:hypothetical protein
MEAKIKEIKKEVEGNEEAISSRKKKRVGIRQPFYPLVMPSSCRNE